MGVVQLENRKQKQRRMINGIVLLITVTPGIVLRVCNKFLEAFAKRTFCHCGCNGKKCVLKYDISYIKSVT